MGDDCGLLQVVLRHVSETCAGFGAGEAIAVNRPTPSKHCSTLASIEWFPATGRGGAAVAHGRWEQGGERFRGPEKEGGTHRGSWLLKRRGHGGSRGPLPWPVGAASVAAIIILFLFFSASFCSTFLSVLLGGLTACAPFCCT